MQPTGQVTVYDRDEKFTAKHAKELMLKARLMEYEKELKDIVAEIKSQASRGSSTIETWISEKASRYVIQKLEELEFSVIIPEREFSDSTAEIWVTIDW